MYSLDYFSNINNNKNLIINIFKDNELLNSIRNNHIKLYSILFKTASLLEKNNINYTLAAGNVLGQVRNKELIFYDDDIDLLILDEDLDKLKSKNFLSDCKEQKITLIYEVDQAFHLFNEYSKNNFITLNKNQYWSSNNIFNKPIAGNPNQVDIFIYKNNPKTMICDYGIGPWRGKPISYTDFKNTKFVKFGPIYVRMMNDPIKYLNNFLEGDYINSNFQITHLHSNLLKNIFKNKFPYKLNKKEIELIKNFSFNIKKNEIIF